MPENIIENKFIEFLVREFLRSPRQINHLNESDAELIRLPGTNLILAITTDSISEEIETGLYSDAYLIGWMTVMVNASDLAAVGAEPVGILLNESFPREAGTDFLESLQKGIRDACSVCQMPVLGGDTNFSTKMQMGGCAIGILRDGKLLMRTGCKSGDLLFASGKLGQGISFAFNKLMPGDNETLRSHPYQPGPRLKEGMLLRNFASCCMDTSDGMIAALDQLMRLNQTGFEIETGMEDWIHEDARRICQEKNIPLWWMLAGPHGEFELIFTIPPDQVEDFMKSAAAMGWNPILLGKATMQAGLRLPADGRSCLMDTVRIRNLFDQVSGDLENYIKELWSLEHQLKNHESER